jgi:hypothetical protein
MRETGPHLPPDLAWKLHIGAGFSNASCRQRPGHYSTMPTFEDLFQRKAPTSRIQNDCGNCWLASWVELRSYGPSRGGRRERRNAGNGDFRAINEALAPPCAVPRSTFLSNHGRPDWGVTTSTSRSYAGRSPGHQSLRNFDRRLQIRCETIRPNVFPKFRLGTKGRAAYQHTSLG